MPLRFGGYQKIEMLPLAERVAIRHDFQDHWYRMLRDIARGLAVLDVGAGGGHGGDVLADVVHSYDGIDPLPCGPRVRAGTLADIASRSVDWGLAVDVIEHVEDDSMFLSDIIRVSRVGAFLSTPNWLTSRCENVFHVREYTPDEITALLAPHRYSCWMSGKDCVVHSISAFAGAPEARNFAALIDLRGVDGRP